MAVVVLLRGINVGGHKTLRPTILAEQLKHLDPVNLGAAGTIVIRKRIPQAQLRVELERRLPFEAGIVICEGREFVRIVSEDPFAREPARPDVVRFVSVLSQHPLSVPATPLSFPEKGRWLMRILARDRRFVFGLYRRDMKVIGYLGTLDRLFGVPVTTRNWNTVTAIVRVLTNGEC